MNPDFKIYEELKPYVDKFLNNEKFNFKDAADTAKDYLKELYALPIKLNRFVDDIGKGRVKFSIDDTEIRRELNKFKTTAVRFMALFLFFLSGALGYYLYLIGDIGFFIPVAGIVLLALVTALFYRKESKIEKIKKHLDKMM